MNLNRFLNTSEKCPVCGNQLSLYMQTIDGPLWKGSIFDNDIFSFRQVKCKDSALKNEFILVTNKNDNCYLEFSDNSFCQRAKTWNIFFYLLCNENSIEEKVNYNFDDDYIIKVYSACYYTSSSFMEYDHSNHEQWSLKICPGADQMIDNVRDEVCVFSEAQKDGIEKNYILDLDYENKSTILRYFLCNPDEKKVKHFSPDTFKIELPLLNPRPNFSISDRSKLLSRFDSWIILS